MKLIKCPKCGEMYSDSYRTCPFCQEDEALKGRAAAPRRKVTRRRRAPSILGPAMVLVVVLAAVLALTALAGKNDGRLKLGRWSLVLWQSKLSQMLLILVCIVWAALLALIFALGATFAWYCVLVAALVIFALTVWFTIKLM